MACVPERRTRLSATVSARLRRRAARRRQAQARAGGQRHSTPAPAAAEYLVGVLQHGRSGGRRIHAGENRAAARDRHGIQHRGVHPGAVPRPGGPRARVRSRPISPVSTRRTGRRRRSTIRRRRARCSTISATRIATATATARVARRQAADHRALVDADLARAPGRRAVEEEHGRDRYPHGVQEGQAPGAAQDGAGRQAADAPGRLECRLSRCGEFHAAALRSQHRPGQRLALQAARVRPPLRTGAHAARLAQSGRESSTA